MYLLVNQKTNRGFLEGSKEELLTRITAVVNSAIWASREAGKSKVEEIVIETSKDKIIAAKVFHSLKVIPISDLQPGMPETILRPITDFANMKTLKEGKPVEINRAGKIRWPWLLA